MLRGVKSAKSSLGMVCFAVAFVFATGSWAVDIQAVQGDLSINQGSGFQKVDGRIDANIGDSVMVGPDGSATVSYPDGCRVSVQPGAVMTVAPLSPCASGSFAAQDQFQNQNPYLTPLLIGGLVLGGAAALAILVSQNHSSSPSPASP
jgi:hypothetical protein